MIKETINKTRNFLIKNFLVQRCDKVWVLALLVFLSIREGIYKQSNVKHPDATH